MAVCKNRLFSRRAQCPCAKIGLKKGHRPNAEPATGNAAAEPLPNHAAAAEPALRSARAVGAPSRIRHRRRGCTRRRWSRSRGRRRRRRSHIAGGGAPRTAGAGALRPTAICADLDHGRRRRSKRRPAHCRRRPARRHWRRRRPMWQNRLI